MHLICAICSDIVTQSLTLFVTKCGHLFHHACLLQWLERSNSCPQCRQKVTEKCMFRVFPSMNNENSILDSTTLQTKLDDAQLQIRESVNKCHKQEEKILEITKELENSKNLAKAYKKEVSKLECTVTMLTEQVRYMKDKSLLVKDLQDENEALKKEIKTLINIQKVLSGTQEDVETMLEHQKDIRTVTTLCAALKRGLLDSEENRKQMRRQLQAAEREANEQRRAREQLLTEIRQYQEREIETGKKREAEEVQRTEPIKMRRMDASAGIESVLHDDADPPLERRSSDTASDRPRLGLKSCLPHVGALYKQKSSVHSAGLKSLMMSTSNKSIFCTNTKSEDSLHNVGMLEVSYDGLGGHAAPDVFPRPIVRLPPKSCAPRLTAKHKLKRPLTQNINRDR